jgi:hypothetical protein
MKAASSYANAVLADHPVLYYRLGETTGSVALDSSGSGRLGLYVGGVLFGQSGAIAVDNDRSATFDGSTGYVNCGFNPFSASSQTIEAWARPTRDSAPGFPQQAVAGIGGSTQLTFGRTPGFAAAYIWPASGVNSGSATSLGDWKQVQTATPLPLNTWTYLVATWNDGTKQWSMYVNGTLSASTTLQGITAGQQSASVPFTIGGFSGQQLFQGGIDEVAYYAYGLSPQQILAHYNAARGPVRTGILSHIATGGSWDTTITLANTLSFPVTVRLLFHADDGSSLTLRLATIQQGVTQNETSATLERVINPNATLRIETGDPAAPLVWGWADVLSTGPLGGYAIFRTTPQAGPPSEGTSPLESEFPSSITLAYDNVGNFVTSVALVNLSSASTTITATIWDDAGSLLGTQIIPLAGSGHTAFPLPSQLALTAGKRGMVQFQSAAAGGIVGLGLRFSPFGTFTSVPTMRSQ